MDSIFDTVVKSATPWYIRHWRTIMVVILAISIAGYISVLQNRLTTQAQMLKIASEDLVRVTAQYQADIAYLKASIYKQNLAIIESEKATKLAKAELAYAAVKSSEVRTKADKQVNQILTQPKPVNADAAITSMVVGVSYLQWEQLK